MEINPEYKSEFFELIQQAKKGTGKVLELGLKLEDIINEKIKLIANQRLEDAARLRAKEKPIAKELKALLDHKELSALELLQKVIELRVLSPENQEWTEQALTDPRQLYRYRQIMALLEAFGIEKNYFSFLKGDFIRLRNERNYENLSENVKQTFIANSITSEVDTSIGKIGMLYSIALNYRIQLQRTMNYWKNYLIMEPLLLYPQLLTKGLNDEMRKKIEPLDALLSFIIDPDQKQFPILELIKKFNYPDIDIEQVDRDTF